MERVIVASARKHGILDHDMMHGYRNPIRVFQLDDQVMLVGADELDVSSRHSRLAVWESDSLH
ncbi:MAG: hypothetical protein GEU79_12405 [Acidimicrobiia bacterium]|nr:hypothetical protein [Acidimicrobiia bacterium]